MDPLSPPSPNAGTTGGRSSARTRSKPVEFWKNETPSKARKDLVLEFPDPMPRRASAVVQPGNAGSEPEHACKRTPNQRGAGKRPTPLPHNTLAVAALANQHGVVAIPPGAQSVQHAVTPGGAIGTPAAMLSPASGQANANILQRHREAAAIPLPVGANTRSSSRSRRCAQRDVPDQHLASDSHAPRQSRAADRTQAVSAGRHAAEPVAGGGSDAAPGGALSRKRKLDPVLCAQIQVLEVAMPLGASQLAGADGHRSRRKASEMAQLRMKGQAAPPVLTDLRHQHQLQAPVPAGARMAEVPAAVGVPARARSHGQKVSQAPALAAAAPSAQPPAPHGSPVRRTAAMASPRAAARRPGAPGASAATAAVVQTAVGVAPQKALQQAAAAVVRGNGPPLVADGPATVLPPAAPTNNAADDAPPRKRARRDGAGVVGREVDGCAGKIPLGTGQIYSALPSTSVSNMPVPSVSAGEAAAAAVVRAAAAVLHGLHAHADQHGAERSKGVDSKVDERKHKSRDKESKKDKKERKRNKDKERRRREREARPAATSIALVAEQQQQKASEPGPSPSSPWQQPGRRAVQQADEAHSPPSQARPAADAPAQGAAGVAAGAAPTVRDADPAIGGGQLPTPIADAAQQTSQHAAHTMLQLPAPAQLVADAQQPVAAAASGGLPDLRGSQMELLDGDKVAAAPCAAAQGETELCGTGGRPKSRSKSSEGVEGQPAPVATVQQPEVSAGGGSGSIPTEGQFQVRHDRIAAAFVLGGEPAAHAAAAATGGSQLAMGSSSAGHAPRPSNVTADKAPAVADTAEPATAHVPKSSTDHVLCSPTGVRPMAPPHKAGAAGAWALGVSPSNLCSTGGAVGTALVLEHPIGQATGANAQDPPAQIPLRAGPPAADATSHPPRPASPVESVAHSSAPALGRFRHQGLLTAPNGAAMWSSGVQESPRRLVPGLGMQQQGPLQEAVQRFKVQRCRPPPTQPCLHDVPLIHNLRSGALLGGGSGPGSGLQPPVQGGAVARQSTPLPQRDEAQPMGQSEAFLGYGQQHHSQLGGLEVLHEEQEEAYAHGDAGGCGLQQQQLQQHQYEESPHSAYQVQQQRAPRVFSPEHFGAARQQHAPGLNAGVSPAASQRHSVNAPGGIGQPGPAAGPQFSRGLGAGPGPMSTVAAPAPAWKQAGMLGGAHAGGGDDMDWAAQQPLHPAADRPWQQPAGMHGGPGQQPPSHHALLGAGTLRQQPAGSRGHDTDHNSQLQQPMLERPTGSSSMPHATVSAGVFVMGQPPQLHGASNGLVAPALRWPKLAQVQRPPQDAERQAQRLPGLYGNPIQQHAAGAGQRPAALTAPAAAAAGSSVNSLLVDRALASAKQEAQRSKGRTQSVADGQDGWSLDETHALQAAFFSVLPTHPHFWQEVARQVPGKSAAECFEQVYRNGRNPEDRAVALKVLRRQVKKQAAPAAGQSSGKRPTLAAARKWSQQQHEEERIQRLQQLVGADDSEDGDSGGADEEHVSGDEAPVGAVTGRSHAQPRQCASGRRRGGARMEDPAALQQLVDELRQKHKADRFITSFLSKQGGWSKWNKAVRLVQEQRLRSDAAAPATGAQQGDGSRPAAAAKPHAGSVPGADPLADMIRRILAKDAELQDRRTWREDDAVEAGREEGDAGDDREEGDDEELLDEEEEEELRRYLQQEGLVGPDGRLVQ